jgi:hypothetical protein
LSALARACVLADGACGAPSVTVTLAIAWLGVHFENAASAGSSLRNRILPCRIES